MVAVVADGVDHRGGGEGRGLGAVLPGHVRREKDELAVHVEVDHQLVGEEGLEEGAGPEEGGRHLIGLLIVHVQRAVGLRFEVVEVAGDG